MGITLKVFSYIVGRRLSITKSRNSLRDADIRPQHTAWTAIAPIFEQRTVNLNGNRTSGIFFLSTTCLVLDEAIMIMLELLGCMSSTCFRILSTYLKTRHKPFYSSANPLARIFAHYVNNLDKYTVEDLDVSRLEFFLPNFKNSTASSKNQNNMISIQYCGSQCNQDH